VFVRILAALASLVAATVLPANAGRIDIGDLASAKVAEGKDVFIHFGVWNYAAANPGASQYPTSLGLLVLGPAPSSGSTLLVPDGTAAYVPGYLFEGYLESLDGSISVPLVDPLAVHVGLPPGFLLLAPAAFAAGGAGPVPVAAIGASVSFSEALSEALFGVAVGSYDNAAIIRLRNRGADFEIGLGSTYPVRTSVSIPGVTGSGPAATSGVNGRVLLENPEPSTWVLLAAGLGLIAWGRRRYRPR
jgi:hypothetical protein